MAACQQPARQRSQAPCSAASFVTCKRHEIKGRNLMGRKPVGKRPMTPAERQRRRRKRLQRERAKQEREAKREERRAKSPYITLPHAVLRIDPTIDMSSPVVTPPSKEELADEI